MLISKLKGLVLTLKCFLFQNRGVRGGDSVSDLDGLLRERAADITYELHLPRGIHHRRELPARCHQQHV